MDYLLAQCCNKMINLLKVLKENGSITQEEFNNHIKIKQQFLSDFILNNI